RYSMITSERCSISLLGDSWPYSFRLRNTRTQLGSHVSKARRSRQKEKFSSRPDGWKFMAVKPRVTSRRKICRLSGKANALRRLASKSEPTRPSHRLATPKRPFLVRWRAQENLLRMKNYVTRWWRKGSGHRPLAHPSSRR